MLILRQSTLPNLQANVLGKVEWTPRQGGNPKLLQRHGGASLMKIKTITLLLFAVLSLQAQTLTALRTDETIRIDGQLTEPSWQAANFIEFSNAGRSDNQVRVSTLWDDSALYFAYQVTDAHLETGAPNIWQDDGVEFFVDTKHAIINIFDETVFANVSVKTVLSQGYTTEIALPWSPFVPASGLNISCLFANNDRDNGVSNQFDWLGLIDTGSYFRPELWGDLKLSSELADGPPEPPDTTVTEDGRTVRLTWHPNTESDLAGYKAHAGLQPRTYSTTVDVGNNLQYAFTGLAQNFTWYFAATAYDMAGNESEYSAEVALFLEPQAIAWAAPRIALLSDTTSITLDSLQALPIATDTLDIVDELWIASWKNDVTALDEGWDIEEADSLVYRFKATTDSVYQFYVQKQGIPDIWLLQLENKVVYEIGVAAHKNGRQATFSPSALFRRISGSGFILLQLRR
jgi:hypothetical protein